MNNHIGYIEQLKQNRERNQNQREPTLIPSELPQRIELWFCGLSIEDQRRPWTMKEFRVIFSETPQKIGAALFALGWTRKRMWRDESPTARYWLKQKLP